MIIWLNVSVYFDLNIIWNYILKYKEPNDAKIPDDKEGKSPHAPTPPKTLTTTMDYFKQRIQNLVMPTARLKDEPPVSFPSTSSQEINQNKIKKEGGESYNEVADENENMYESWKSLSPNHWLTLFSYYNVSLYNRYVAILPQINLVRYEEYGYYYVINFNFSIKIKITYLKICQSFNFFFKKY